MRPVATILPIVHSGGNPCDGMPTISSVGSSSVVSTGDCTSAPITLRTTLTISGSLPGGAAVQYRTSWGTSATPSYGSWITWGAFTGTSDNLDINTEVGSGSTTDNGNSSSTYYYAIQFQLLGTDTSTVCDGPDTGAGWSGLVYSCFA